MKQQQQFIKQFIPKDSFRMMIYGASNTGKTYFLKNFLLPVLKKKFDKVYIFTVKHNVEPYKRRLESLGFVDTESYTIFDDPNPMFIRMALTALNELKNKLYKLDEYDSDDNPIYSQEWLYIFDDILNKKLTESPEFLDIFISGRHSYTSVIMISQVTTDIVTPKIKGNLTHKIIFPTDNKFQKLEYLNLIGSAIESAYDDQGQSLSESEIREKANTFYIRGVKGEKNKYRYIIIDGKNKMMLSPKGKVSKDDEDNDENYDNEPKF